MLHNTRLERFAEDKQFSFLGLFVSYKVKENEVLWIRALGPVNDLKKFIKEIEITSWQEVSEMELHLKKSFCIDFYTIEFYWLSKLQTAMVPKHLVQRHCA